MPNLFRGLLKKGLDVMCFHIEYIFYLDDFLIDFVRLLL